MSDRGRLGPAERHAALVRARAETFDVVVIGGGATGTGSALDAARSSSQIQSGFA